MSPLAQLFGMLESKASQFEHHANRRATDAVTEIQQRDIWQCYQKYIANDPGLNLNAEFIAHFTPKEIDEVLFPLYAHQQGLEPYPKLVALIPLDLRIQLLDDPSSRVVFLQTLSTSLNNLTVLDEERMVHLQAENEQNGLSAFSAGNYETANACIEQGKQVFPAIVDRPSDDYLQHYGVSNGRQAYTLLPDGTFLGRKGSGFFGRGALSHESDGKYPRHYVDIIRRLKPKIDCFRSRTVQDLAFETLVRDSDNAGPSAVLFVRYVYTFHRLEEFPDLIKTDPGLIRLARRVKNRLVTTGTLSESDAYEPHTMLMDTFRNMGLAEADKMNFGFWGDMSKAQDEVIGGMAADSDQYESLCQHGLLEGASVGLRSLMSFRLKNIFSKLQIIWLVLESAKKQGQLELLFPDEKNPYTELISAFVGGLDKNHQALLFEDEDSELLGHTDLFLENSIVRYLRSWSLSQDLILNPDLGDLRDRLRSGYQF